MSQRLTSNYNLELSSLEDGDFSALYEKRRRDALFCFSLPQADGSLILGRDHLGNAPLFYRARGGSVHSSLFLNDLVEEKDTVSDEGLRTYLALGTTKVASLFNEIHLVPPGTVLRAYPDGRSEVLYEYRIRPRDLQKYSFEQCVREADRLLEQAAGRTIKEKEVGLFLSGGIDSALTGIYLKKAGARVRAYTALPWGPESTEAKFAAHNARTIGVESHTQYSLETARYESYLKNALERYGNPNGAISQLGILSLLEETNIAKERQVYFAQNTDTSTCSMPDQSLVYFTSFLPRFLQKLLHPALGGRSLTETYVSFRTKKLLRHSSALRAVPASALEELTLAGMLFGHTPVDGEIITLPAMRAGSLISNLFYDMDVVEFCMGVPMRYRIERARDSKIGIGFGKHIFKALAARHLPPEIVNRKKGLTVPTRRDKRAEEFFNILPTRAGSIPLLTEEHRFAAELLKRWSQRPEAPRALQELFSNA